MKFFESVLAGNGRILQRFGKMVSARRKELLAVINENKRREFVGLIKLHVSIKLN